MTVAQLKAEAARIFSLDLDAEVILVLFSAVPQTLKDGDTIGISLDQHFAGLRMGQHLQSTEVSPMCLSTPRRLR
jgi:hypothetical protein